MTRTGTHGLVMVGAFIALLVVTSVVFIKPNPDSLRGTVIGAALGLVNLALGYLVTRRALVHGLNSAIVTIGGGFVARLLALAGLIVLFQRTGAADPAAFALTFLVFFFVFVGLEVVLVERSLGGKRGAA